MSTEAYTAKKNQDGTFDILAVPIFQETVDSRDKDHFNYDKNFLQRIVERHKELEFKGHFKPIHLGHHKSTENRRNVGSIRNLQIKKYDGTPTVFADLHRVPEDVYLEMKDGRIPYRSPEIDPTSDKPCFSSLSLLSTQDPYFEFPNLQIKEVEFRKKIDGNTILFCKSGNKVKPILKFEKGTNMKKKIFMEEMMRPEIFSISEELPMEELVEPPYIALHLHKLPGGQFAMEDPDVELYVNLLLKSENDATLKLHAENALELSDALQSLIDEKGEMISPEEMSYHQMCISNLQVISEMFMEKANWLASKKEAVTQKIEQQAEQQMAAAQQIVAQMVRGDKKRKFQDEFAAKKEEEQMLEGKDKKKMAEEAEAEPETPDEEAPEEESQPENSVIEEKISALEDQLSAMTEKLDALTAKLDELLTGAPEAPADPVAEDSSTPDEPKKMSKSKKKGIFSKLFEIESKVQDREQDAMVNNLVDDLLKLGADFNESNVRETAKHFAKMGEASFKRYCDSLKTNVAQSQEIQDFPQADNILLKYSKNPDTFKIAKEAHQFYITNKNNLHGISQDDWIKGEIVKYQRSKRNGKIKF